MRSSAGCPGPSGGGERGREKLRGGWWGGVGGDAPVISNFDMM